MHINKDLDYNLDLKFVSFSENTGLLNSHLVINDDNGVSFENLIRNSWYFLDLSFFELLFFLFPSFMRYLIAR